MNPRYNRQLPLNLSRRPIIGSGALEVGFRNLGGGIGAGAWAWACVVKLVRDILASIVKFDVNCRLG